MLAADARKSSSDNSTGEEKYIHGDYHAYRASKNDSTNRLDDVTPVRSTKKTKSKNLSLAWSTESSEQSTNKTQIEFIDSKYFRPPSSNLTQTIEAMGS